MTKLLQAHMQSLSARSGKKVNKIFLFLFWQNYPMNQRNPKLFDHTSYHDYTYFDNLHIKKHKKWGRKFYESNVLSFLLKKEITINGLKYFKHTNNLFKFKYFFMNTNLSSRFLTFLYENNKTMFSQSLVYLKL